MTLVAFASAKGSPGTTTLATLIGASWPTNRQIVVADCDPSGGDLAIRFGLQGSTGWTTLAAATRRRPDASSLQSHLQALPGGLEVLAGVKSTDPIFADVGARSGVAGALHHDSLTIDILADVGRLLPGLIGSSELLMLADDVVLVARHRSYSVVQIHEKVEAVRNTANGRIHLLLVGSGPYGAKEIENYAGVHLLGEVPYDAPAAAVASGESKAVRRLDRSTLAAACRRIALVLSRCGASLEERNDQFVAELEVAPSVSTASEASDSASYDRPLSSDQVGSDDVPENRIRVLP